MVMKEKSYNLIRLHFYLARFLTLAQLKRSNKPLSCTSKSKSEFAWKKSTKIYRSSWFWVISTLKKSWNCLFFSVVVLSAKIIVLWVFSLFCIILWVFNVFVEWDGWNVKVQFCFYRPSDGKAITVSDWNPLWNIGNIHQKRRNGSKKLLR